MQVLPDCLNFYDEFEGAAYLERISKLIPRDTYTDIDETDSHKRTTNATSSKTSSSRKKLFAKKHNFTEEEIARLIKDAPPNSVKQTINVEREEEEIIGPLPLNHADGSNSGPEGLLNFDTIAEHVDLGIEDGCALLAVKVKCERVVPIRGVEDMFKKSSVVVTRNIAIDLLVTDERKILLDRIMNKTYQHAIDSGQPFTVRGRKNEAKLSTKDTFNLYKTFMGLAEADNDVREQTIEKRVEEERHLPENSEYFMENDVLFDDNDMPFGDEIQFEYDTAELDRRLEDTFDTVEHNITVEEINSSHNYLRPDQDFDTISYRSAVSNDDSILF